MYSAGPGVVLWGLGRTLGGGALSPSRAVDIVQIDSWLDKSRFPIDLIRQMMWIRRP